MSKLKYILLLCVVIAGFASCSKDPVKTDTYTADEVKLRLSVSTPGITMPSVRAVDEGAVSSVSVLVFENTGSGFQFGYAVPGYLLTESAGAADYEFLARIVQTSYPVRLYIIANPGNSLSGLTIGMNEAEARTAVTQGFSPAGFPDVLPMTGMVEFAGGIVADTTVQGVVLLRSVARVDVLNTAANFIMTSVRVFRTNNLVQLIPDSVNNNLVTEASVPASAQQNVNTDPLAIPVDSTSFRAQVYIPESDITPEANRTSGATVVVVGGIYEDTGVTTYYRMDFDPDGQAVGEDLFGQVLRNHLYQFNIEQVLAPGWPTEEEAANNISSQISTVIQVWDEATKNMVFDGLNHLGVSSRTVRLSYGAGSEGEVLVETSLDSYVAYWGNEDGTIPDGAAEIAFGQTLDDPDGLFNASVSADGTEIIFSSLLPYDTATARNKYLVLAAGRFRIVITVFQGPATYTDRAIGIFGSTREIGSWGNFVTNTGWSPEPGVRARGLGIMLQGTLAAGPQNFGPGKTVDMKGIYIDGRSLNERMPRNYYQGSDVLYLEYTNNPVQTDVDDIISWVEEDENRVLVVQFDNSATNERMMVSLGFPSTTRIYSGTITGFSYDYVNAPDFIKYGPFGSITSDFTYKCRDNAYTAIEPATADALGYIPILLSNGGASTGYYLMAVNPQKRIVLVGDCDVYSNNGEGAAGYYLDFGNTSVAQMTVDPANPAHVLMGNLFAWIVDVVLRVNE